MARNFSYIDAEFIRQIGMSLDKFKMRRSTAICRCPFCGDSEHSKRKTRGYFIVRKDDSGTVYYCHNCGMSVSLQHFLDKINHSMGNDYRFRLFEDDKVLRNWNTTTAAPKTEIKATDFNIDHGRMIIMSNSKPISGMSKTDPEFIKVASYLAKRYIPVSEAKKLWYSTPTQFHKIQSFGQEPPAWNPRDTDKHSFIVIPLKDIDGNIYACQGRAIGEYNGPKYMTSIFNKSIPKCWGLDRVKTILVGEYIFVVEGPIDAMFLKNTIAMAGSNPTEIVSYLRDRGIANQIVFVYDNEPLNKDIVRQIKSRLSEGHLVVIWDESRFGRFKDINDMVLGGIKIEEIQNFIQTSCVGGLMAELRLKSWSKLYG